MPICLFTIVCDFDGGTYVSQVRAMDEQQAVDEWAELLKQDKPVGTVSVRIAIAANEKEDALTPLHGLIGAWCWTAAIDDRLALATIIRST